MASTTYYADIQKLYVAYFNRPADVAGLQHWQGVLERTNGDLSLVSNAFAASKEYKDAYAGKSALATVATVYQNLFGHANDMEGMMWWAERLADGRFTIDVAVKEIAKGAQGSDLTAYNNKVTVATTFTNSLDTIAEITGYDGDAANARAKAFMAKVTDDASMANAIATLDAEIIVVVTPPAPPVTSYTLTASAAAVDEGKTVYFNLGSTNAVAGSEFTYTISGVDAGDIVGGLIGTVKLDSTGKAVIAVTLSADASTEGLEKLSLEVAGKTVTVDVNDVSLTPAPVPTYSLAASSTIANEGTTVFFNLDSTNATPGSVFTYTITGVDAADVVGGLTGTVTLDANGKAVIAVELVADAKTEGLENLTVAVAGKSAVVAVADTSTTPVTAITYALSASSATVDEGSQVTFKLDTTGVAAGTVLSYQLTGIDASRVNGATSGQVVVDANGQALIIVKTFANAFTDGATTMQLALVNGLAAANVGVNDTSMTPTVFTIDSAKIVAANNTLSPVVVTVADTGTATVNLNSTTTVYAKGGIVIQGDADVTLNMGRYNDDTAPVEEVYVTGTGNTKVVFGSQSTTSVYLANGNDTIVVNGLTTVDGQDIDMGAGTDTLDVNGTNDFTLGTLSGVEHITMHSSAKFNASQLVDVQTITELGTDGTLSIVADEEVSLDLTGKLFGKIKLNIGAGMEVILSAAELANITAVSGAGAVTTTVAGAQLLLAINANANYNIVDTAENLANAPAAVFEKAIEVKQAGAENLTIDQAVAVFNASPVAQFTVSATADAIVKAMVFQSTFEALVSERATIVVTTPANAQQVAIMAEAGLNATVALSDTPDNMFGLMLSLTELDIDDNLIINPDLDLTITGITLEGVADADTAEFLTMLAEVFGLTLGGLHIVDDSWDLLELSPEAVAAAQSIRLDEDNWLDTTDAVALKGLVGAKLVGGYNLEDSAADLLASPAIVSGATDVYVDGEVGVAVAAQLTKLAPKGELSYDLVDSANNLFSATDAVLANARYIEVNGFVTVAQATKLVNYEVESFELRDTAAAILGASKAVIDMALADNHLTVTDASINAATAAAIYALDDLATYVVVDSAANLIAGDALALDRATSVTISGTATVAQAEDVLEMDIDVAAYVLSDTVANILAASVDVKAGASKISATGAATAAQAKALESTAKFDHNFAVVDTAANVAALIAEGATGIAVLNKSSAPVVMTGAVDVAQAALLRDVTFTKWDGKFNLVDSYADLSNPANAAILAAAQTVYVEDSIADVNANFAWIVTNADGYMLADTILALTTGNGVVVAGAKAGHATDVASAAQATTLFGLNGNIEYAVSDSAANLAAVLNKTGVQNASLGVTVVGAANVANAKTILAMHADVEFALNDTAANLANSTNAATVKAATAVNVSNTATAAQATAIFTQNADVAFLSITDSVAAIQAMSAEARVKAGALVVTDGNRLVLTVADVTQFGFDIVTGNLVNVTSSVASLDDNSVSFNLSDTLENLANALPMLAFAGKVTVVAGTEAIEISAADAALAALPADTVIGSYNVEGSVADLLTYAAATEGATGVTATGIPATVAQAKALFELNGAAEYDVQGTAADLAATANKAATAAADEVFVSGPATVAQVQAVLALSTGADFSAVQFADTAAKLAAAPAGMLEGHDIIVNGEATVAQYVAIAAAAGYDVSMAINDTAANIAAYLAANGPWEIAGSGITVSTDATALQATALSNLWWWNTDYNVVDTAANIIATPWGLWNADSITVDGVVTADVATDLEWIEDNYGSMNIDIVDTAANLLNPSNESGVRAADSVVVTGNIDVATAALISMINGDAEYTIVDTLDHMIEAISQLNGGLFNFDLNDVLGNADSVTITGGAELDLFIIDGEYYVTGSVAALKALPAAIIGWGYQVEDTVANIVADYGFASGSVFGEFIITDSAANLLSAAESLLWDADRVNVTGVTNAADAVEIGNIVNDVVVFAAITDTVKNLADNSWIISYSENVTATGQATAAQADQLGSAKFAVSDSAASLLASMNGYANATAVTVTGTGTTVAQIQAILGANENVVSYNLTGVAADLVAEVELVEGATAVVVTGTATALQARDIYTANSAAKYHIAGSAAVDLFTANVVNVWVSAAQSVTGALTLNVAQAQAAIALGAKFVGTFAISDKASAIAAASQSLLDLATGVTVTSAATAAEATMLASLTFGVGETAITYTVSDTAAALLANAAGIDGVNVTITDAVSIEQAVEIDDIAGTVVVKKLVDNSTSLQLGSADIVNAAELITVTDTQTIGQASFLLENVGTGATFTFTKIVDSVTNVLSDVATAKLAASLTLTGNATVDQAKLIAADSVLKSLGGSLKIVDEAQVILDAFFDSNFKATVTGAASIVVTDTVSAAEAKALAAISNVAIGELDIVDTLAAINALSSGIVNLSDSVTATIDVDAGVRQVFTDAGMSTSATIRYIDNSVDSVGAGANGVSLIGTTPGGISQYNTAGADVLTLKVGDLLDLSAWDLAGGRSADDVVGDNMYQIFQGGFSSGGGLFTEAASGTSTLIVWDDDSSAGVHLVGVILVGQVESGLDLSGIPSATKLGLLIDPVI